VKCKIVTKINLSATLIIPALFSCNLNINHIPTNLYSIQFVSKIYPVKTSILGKLCNTIKLGFNNSELHFNQPRYGSLCRTYEEYRAIPIKFCFTPLYTGLYYQGMTTSFGFIYKQFSNTGRAIGAPSNRPITKITTIIKTASNASNGDKRITNIFTLQKWRCSSILTARPLRMVFIGRLNSTYRFSFTKTLGRK
jgi:hypothetical protein